MVNVDTLLENAREKIDSLLARHESYLLKESLRQSTIKRIGESHEDISELNLFQVPIVMVGAKYDIFQVGHSLVANYPN